MAAHHHIDIENCLILTIWEGEVIDLDVIAALKKYQKEIQSRSDLSGYNEMLDFSKAAEIKLTVEGIKSIGQLASITDKKDINTKLAIVVNSNLVFGLARMYAAYRSLSSNANKEICVYKDESEAFKWLTEIVR